MNIQGLEIGPVDDDQVVSSTSFRPVSGWKWAYRKAYWHATHNRLFCTLIDHQYKVIAVGHVDSFGRIECRCCGKQLKTYESQRDLEWMR